MSHNKMQKKLHENLQKKKVFFLERLLAERFMSLFK
jgi:hypothetical protein